MRPTFTILCLLITSTSFAAKAQKDLCVDIPHSTAEFDDAKKLKGCRLTEIEAGSTYERLGLKIGDLVQPENSGSNRKLEMINTLRSSTTNGD